MCNLFNEQSILSIYITKVLYYGPNIYYSGLSTSCKKSDRWWPVARLLLPNPNYCCLFFFDIRILIAPLVSANSSYFIFYYGNKNVCQLVNSKVTFQLHDLLFENLFLSLIKQTTAQLKLDNIELLVLFCLLSIILRLSKQFKSDGFVSALLLQYNSHSKRYRHTHFYPIGFDYVRHRQTLTTVTLSTSR